MTFTPLKLPEASLFVPERYFDTRGYFQENFRLADTQRIKEYFEVRQVNHSFSSKGVLRGIHWVNNYPGQAKYVTCASGAILDFVVDLRPDSPNFGRWDVVELSAANGQSLLIGRELGHAFLALQDETVVTYLCSEPYLAGAEVTVNPLSPELGIPFASLAKNFGINNLILSEKDKSASGLEQFKSQ